MQLRPFDPAGTILGEAGINLGFMNLGRRVKAGGAHFIKAVHMKG